MKTNLAGIISTVLVLSILGACNLPGSGAGSPAASGNCTNPLFPVVPLAIWDYASTGSSVGDYSFSQTVSNARADGFTLSYEYSTGVSTVQEWSCQGGSLVQSEAGSGPATALWTINGAQAETETENLTGVTLPASVNAGDTWSQTYDLSGEVSLPEGAAGSGEGSYIANYSALGVENVAVPAGTFEAMRIQLQAVYSLEVTIEEYDLTVPVDIGATMTLWYAPGVGVVKIESMNDMTGAETIELVRYRIP